MGLRPAAAGPRTTLISFARKRKIAPAAEPRRSTEIRKETRDMRRAGVGMAFCHTASLWAGRGLPTWAAETMSFECADEGACGMMSFWKQVGQSSCAPLVLESAVICCPQTGHANLNSLIALARTIPYRGAADNVFYLQVAPGATWFYR